MTHQTVIVTGMMAGGTTCVARVVDALGVPMMVGGLSGRRACECRWFGEAIVDGDWPVVERAVAESDAKHDRWGFKRPAVYGHLSDRFGMFRSPMLIYVMRDISATAESMRRRGHLDPRAMIDAAEEHARMAHLIPTCGVPYLFVSYEKMMTHMRRAIGTICEFLSADESNIPSAEQQVIVDDPRYRSQN